MEIQKSFVTTDNQATLCCPKCGLTKIIAAGKYQKKKHVIKVRCNCKYAFATLLDFRRHYRKEVEFEGTYTMIEPAGGIGRLSVLNISRSGVGFAIGFTVAGKTAFKVGQRARIEFDLDDKNQTPINKVVVIRTISEKYVGCEFVDHQELDKSLGFYLAP